MGHYVNEIKQLRGLGFAEGLLLGGGPRSQGMVARLESGKAGIAVEFHSEPVPTYSIVALDASVVDAPKAMSHRWDDVVQDIRRRMPPSSDD